MQANHPEVMRTVCSVQRVFVSRRIYLACVCTDGMVLVSSARNLLLQDSEWAAMTWLQLCCAVQHPELLWLRR